MRPKFLLTVARLAFAIGDLEHAAQLVAAARAAPIDINAYLGIVNRAEYDTLRSTIRSALGEDRFDELRAVGRSLSLDDSGSVCQANAGKLTQAAAALHGEGTAAAR